MNNYHILQMFEILASILAEKGCSKAAATVLGAQEEFQVKIIENLEPPTEGELRHFAFNNKLSAVTSYIRRNNRSFREAKDVLEFHTR